MFLAGLLILAFLFLFRRSKLKISKAHIFPLLLLGLSSVYLANAFEFWGLQYLSAAKACLIYSLSPFIAATLSYFRFREKITPKKIFGLFIGFIGFAPVFLYDSADEYLAGKFCGFSWAEIAIILATMTSVYGWILLRKLGKDEGVSPVVANGISMVFGGLMALIHATFVEGVYPVAPGEGAEFFKWISVMIVVSNLFCYNLYGWLLKRFTATFLSFAGLTTPIFAAVWGFVMHRETVPYSFFISMGIVALGLWLVYAEELRLGYITRGVKRDPT